MNDVQLFIIGCVLFAPVLLVMFGSILETRESESIKPSEKPINFYIYQIAFSVLLIAVFVLLGVLIFKM
ncbi:MAG: hypothetical protein CMC93_03850 [Flavobacteriaceae bacterium]|nr:hypothetical protein [Flavobacteriaceae bacterium]|tara:strand:+ start:1130 stop:1336 length:207 start_codon:yes stop_codon:yes gene_type:complete